MQKSACYPTAAQNNPPKDQSAILSICISLEGLVVEYRNVLIRLEEIADRALGTIPQASEKDCTNTNSIGPVGLIHRSHEALKELHILRGAFNESTNRLERLA